MAKKCLRQDYPCCDEAATIAACLLSTLLVPTTRHAKPILLFAMRYGNQIGYVWKNVLALRDQAAAQLAQEVDSLIAFPEWHPDGVLQPQHMTPVEIDFYDFSAVNREKLARFLDERPVKAVVYMSALPTAIDAKLFKSRGIATINTENDGFNPDQQQSWLKKLSKFILRRLLKRQIHDLHIANSQTQADCLRHFAQVPESHIALLSDGIDTERFTPGDRQHACQKTGLDPHRLWLMAAAQARSEKRVDWLLHVFAALKKANPALPLGFVYVGDGPCRSAWQAEAERLGLHEDCHFAGQQEDLVPCYQSAHVFIHASERESFGLVLVEAMACGCPVIATASAGPKETLRIGETGELVGMHDATAMQTAIQTYLDHPEKRQKHAQQARTHVVANYSLRRLSQQFADLLRPFLNADHS